LRVRIGTTSRVQGHNVHVRFGDRTYSAIQAFAIETGLAINGCVRVLVEGGLAARNGTLPSAGSNQLAEDVRAIGQTALAGLIAIEETRLLYMTLFPNGRDKALVLREEAGTEARRRLAEVEVALLLEAE